MEDSNSKTSSPHLGSGEDTDVSPSAPEEQVPESGTADFAEPPWNDTKCVFCGQEAKDVNDPKLLQCLHTACKTCLNLESANSPASSTSSSLSKQLLCPQCNQEISINEVIDNLFLIEHLKSQNADGLPEESKIYPCSCDEGTDATGFCADCQEWLCDTCVTAHHRVRVTKDHIIKTKDEMEGEKSLTSLNQKYLFCPAHPLEPLKLYCESCDKLTCRDCQLADHKDHKYQFLPIACEEGRSSFSMFLTKIREKQQHITNACELVNTRHQEISKRELAVTQEIKTFAVKFITDINRRGKKLLQELSEVCNNKKDQLSYKHQELINMGQRLDYCLKFAETALAHGSETALVYSKKAMISQLKRIVKHRCEVPNPQHNVDITFSYEANYLTQYISELGTLLVDQRPVSRLPLTSGQVPQQQIQQPQIQQAPQQMQQQQQQQQQQQPLPQQNSQALVPVRMNNRQLVPARMLPPQQQQQQHQQQMQQRAIQQKQQQNQMQQRQQPQQVHKLPQQSPQHNVYGQSQVTSSTDPAQNRNMQGALRATLNNQITYSRNPAQRNLNQSQSFSTPSSTNNYIPQRHASPQPPVQRQPAPTQSFNQQPASLSMPLIQNSSITISPIPPGPTPPKQRALAPRQGNQPVPNQSSPQRLLQQSIQRTQPQQQQVPGQPQLIVIDGDGPNKTTPNMSNTSRLTHFPAVATAAMSAVPGLQITYNQNSG